MDPTWANVFKFLIILFVAIAGAPFIQWVKIALTKLLKKPVQDSLALLITGIVAAVFAVLEMWLSGVLNFKLITLETFPSTFFAVFSVATVYFSLLKGVEGFFGKGTLLKPVNSVLNLPPPEPPQ